MKAVKPNNKKTKPSNGGLPSKKARKATWLNILPDDIWLRVKRSITIYQALQKTDLDFESECGGVGTCGKCKVRMVTALGPPDNQELKLLTREELESGIRLACRTKIQKSIVVQTDMHKGSEDMVQILKHGIYYDLPIDPLIKKVPAEVAPPDTVHNESDFKRLRDALGPEYQDITVTYQCLASLYKDLRRTGFSGEALLHHGCLLSWTPKDSEMGRYGLVFDIGTTTLVGKLIDLTSGREVAVISKLNSQTRFGTNVIGRIQFIREQRLGLEMLRDRLLKDLNVIVHRLVKRGGIAREQIYVAVAAGNTTMQHILLGLDPSGIAVAPFAPVITEGTAFSTSDIRLDINRDAMLYVMPAKSGYIGGDLISFILSSMVWNQNEKIILGLDFGTNGEIFLGNRDRLLSCSAAAGPALEGARIACGMIARSGAIESFRILEDQLQYNVVGNVRPGGICGSGLVDLVALLLHHGAVDVEGLLGPAGVTTKAGVLLPQLLPVENGDIYEFEVADNNKHKSTKRVYLTQKDIRELQLAKGAIAAGIQILLKEMDMTTEQIDEIYLAGALGNYVHPLSAMRIGLIPNVNPRIVISVGNAASTGATMALMNRSLWEKSLELAEQIQHIELSLHPDFYGTFIEQMNFPSTNLW